MNNSYWLLSIRLLSIQLEHLAREMTLRLSTFSFFPKVMIR
uniref:Uncharacterized protein n=1 Tax=Vibrio tasmaniensis TaxID=212663 RepID=A0A0H3ZXA3_9VIBR|nr:hypothetical protein [Vibrio tasmaniensis]